MAVKITREELAAYDEGRLEGAELARVGLAIANDAGLRARLAAHRARTAQGLQQDNPVITLEARRPRAEQEIIRAATPGRAVSGTGPVATWRTVAVRWFLAPVLIAGAVTTVLFNQPGMNMERAASPVLAGMLDSTLSTDPAGSDGARVPMTLRDHNGTICRVYLLGRESGLACREASGWRVRDRASPTITGGPSPHVMAAAHALSAGEPLDAAAERRARLEGWAPLR